MKYEVVKNYIMYNIEYIEYKNHGKKMSSKDYYKRKYYYEIYKYMKDIEKLFKKGE